MSARILIVEDEALVALELEELLTDAGYKVIGMVADQASLRSICEQPELALVDVNLRDGPSGPVIARQLANGFGTKIVYVTASSSDIGEPAPTTVGVIQKPFCEQTVLAAVDFATNGKSEMMSPPPGLRPIRPN
ncbi:MAG: response regulator [Novosphingobium sp.]|nr:response regulator [Novosphingobium sp.]MCP5401380.1 response regulator [Novosphingobium sp.]